MRNISLYAHCMLVHCMLVYCILVHCMLVYVCLYMYTCMIYLNEMMQQKKEYTTVMVKIIVENKRSQNFAFYIMGIIQETLYIKGSYWCGPICDEYESMGFAIPDDGVYADTLLLYLRHIYPPSDEYRIAFEKITDEKYRVCKGKTAKNENTDRTMFDRYMKPLTYIDTYHLGTVYYDRHWIDYRIKNSPTPINHKWQLLFSSHVYKFYVYYSLACALNKQYASQPYTVEVKTDIINDHEDNYNKDIVVIYSDGDGIVSTPVYHNTLTMHDIIVLLRDVIHLDFRFLRIRKILFRNGDISYISADPKIPENEVRRYFRMYRGNENDYDSHKIPFKNLLKIKSLYDASIDENYRFTKHQSFYDDYRSIQMKGGKHYLDMNLVILLIVSIICVALIVYYISRHRCTQKCNTQLNDTRMPSLSRSTLKPGLQQRYVVDKRFINPDLLHSSREQSMLTDTNTSCANELFN